MKIMRTPRSVEISITTKCNLRCTYCSHYSSAGDVHNDLPASGWLDFFDEIGRSSVMSVTLGGGEPFIRKDLNGLIDGIVKNRMRFSLLSNGSLITDQAAAFIAATGRCDSVQISIDGSCPETHDSLRGEGSFEGAVRGIDILRKHDVPVIVRTTIHRYNLHDLEALAHFLLDELQLEDFSTNYASFMGLCRYRADEISPDTRERTRAMRILRDLNRKYNGRITGTAGPVAESTAWREMMLASRRRDREVPGGGRLSGCSGVMSRLAVRADGMMVPCSQLSHIELGRICERDLKDVWLNHPALERLRRRSDISLKEFEFCRDCEFIDFCTGNCPALAYTLTGEENHPSPDACLKRFLEDGGSLPDEDV